MLGDDVGLAERGTAALVAVERDRRAAEDHTGVDRQVVLAPQRLVERRQDARRLVDGAAADIGAEDLRGMRRLPRGHKPPAAGAAAGDDGRARIAGAVLEADGDVRPGGGLDEVAPGQREG